MDNVYVLLGLLVIIVLLCRHDGRFIKVEKELQAIKRQMDELLKGQARVAPPADEAVVREEAREEVVPRPQEKKVEEEVPPAPTPSVIVEPVPIAPPKKIEKEEPIVRNLPIAPKPRKAMNYEKYIGENLFGKIGILIFVIGVGFFVKYAIDQNWINETFRTVLGFLTGAALLFVAERLQKKYRTFSSLLAGGAFAVFYLTVAIAFHYYHIFSQPVAFIILIVTTVLMCVLSVVYDRRELAITALVGGFFAPFIVSSGNGSYLVLFTYVSILNLGMFGLSVHKKWSELPIISFGFTSLVMLAYLLADYYTGATVVPGHMFLFATLFYFIFLLPVFLILRVEKDQTMSRWLVFVIIANSFVYLLFGIVYLRNMELPFRASGLLSLFIALTNLGLVLKLWKSRSEHKFLVHVLLGLVLTFASITVPIQLDGNYVTLLWAAEMVLLLWLYIQSKIRIYEWAAIIMVALTWVSFLMDAGDGLSSSVVFLNSTFATSLFVGLATLAFGLLMQRYREFFSTAHLLTYRLWNPLTLLVSVGMLYYTFMREFDLHLEGATGTGAQYLFTAISLASVCYALRRRFLFAKHAALYIGAIGVNTWVYMLSVWSAAWVNEPFGPALLRWCTAAFVIANLYDVARQYYASFGLNPRFTVYLNVLATLLWITMVRSFLWLVGVDDFSAGLSLSLSIAGFVQMGLGMRLHQKALRMVSLATFGIVLLKLLFNDLWAMPTIGKIFVFIILGLILLTLSFLYQKLKDVLFKDDEDESVD